MTERIFSSSYLLLQRGSKKKLTTCSITPSKDKRINSRFAPIQLADPGLKICGVKPVLQNMCDFFPTDPIDFVTLGS